ILHKINANKILEVGCGRGTMSLFLSKHLGLKTSLLDNSRDAINIAKKEFIKYGRKGEYYLADALNTGLENEKFDSVISIGLAEHINDVEKLYKEQFRLLEPGGVIISLNFPKKNSIQKLNNIVRFFKKIFGKHKGDIKKDYYRNSLSPDNYKKIAKNVGFDKIETMNVCPFPIFTSISLKFDKKITRIYKTILKLKSIYQNYPYKTNYLISQGHFLVGYKKK
ncbi:class I SAM-dependent methyltransferase, partial [Candidatus Parcubacteria bacterium]|nr:class I SAM-dependent methyltransferase [Candidatus Parcubacteria bacterium]